MGDENNSGRNNQGRYDEGVYKGGGINNNKPTPKPNAKPVGTGNKKEK